MELLKKIHQAGIVGCGGAGFPTHIKLKAKADTFIVNAAECEPLLRTDRYIMRKEAEKVLKAVSEVAKLLAVKDAYVALKETYTSEIEALQNVIEKENYEIKLFKLKNFYPAGDEQITIYEVTGRIVPPGGLPGDVGVVVSNVGTMRAVYDALSDVPLTEKLVTVTGEVERPVIVRVPVGTSITECLKAAYPKPKEYDIILGGPMMGRLVEQENLAKEVVTKTTSGIIVLQKGSYLSKKRTTSIEQMLRKAKTACIQCSFCTQLCSRHMIGHPIEPHKIMRKMAYSNGIDDILSCQDVKNALICSECGICEDYACPMGLEPRTINKVIKNVYRNANERYVRPEGVSYEVNAMREWRRVPSKRLATRIGLESYYDISIDEEVVIEPKTVSIGLRQHIGKPASPVVKKGDAIEKGQLIASVGFEEMGACIHASISGKVKSVSKDRIVLER